MRIVADDKIPFLQGALEDKAHVVYLPGAAISRNDLLGADALITRTRTRCNRDLLEGTPVRFVASATIGHDHIDADFCREAGITWTNAPGCNAASVRQYMVSTLLYLAEEKGLALRGATLGVVGAGNVGSRVAAAAETLGMRVLVNDPPRARVEGPEGFAGLDQILMEADVITFHVPLNREGDDRTWYMVDDAFIDRCREGVVLVNTSRGGVFREESLLRGIRSGKVAHAVLDVFEEEPRIRPELLDLLTLATPHIAGYSLDGKANGTSMSVQALSRQFGLGLDDWTPGSIPAPANPMLLGDAGQEELIPLLWELYRHTYDVGEDDRRLREAPEQFEGLRGNYPLRREPEAYSVKLFQGYDALDSILKQLGFEVLKDYCM